MLRCVALDDYQNVARKFGDWDRLKGRVELHSITEYIPDRDAVAAALKGADIVIAMRERTPFDRALLAELPDLKLLITTGLKNASIDVKAATERALQSPDVAESMKQGGFEPGFMPLDEVERFIKGEYQRWGEVIRGAGIKPG